MSTIELDWLEPFTVLQAFSQQPHLAFFDSGGDASARSRWSFLCVYPRSTLTTSSGDGWKRLQAMLRTPKSATMDAIPFSGGVVGVASYESGLALAGITSRFTPQVPHLTAYAFDGIFAFDRSERRLFWSSDQNAPPLRIPAAQHPPVSRPRAPCFLTPDLSPESWKAAVEEIRVRIAKGDFFQANMTARWRGETALRYDVLELYNRLRTSSPAPFGGLFRSPVYALLSASVERFIAMSHSGYIETRPIKGTAALGNSDRENARIEVDLKRDAKEWGENLMITDLMRHDISRVCDIGSVTVSELCAVEPFKHVLHLVSTIHGQLAAGRTAINLLQASLPPGSVTGAPKHAALQTIDALEGSARNTYCGTMFWLGNNGAMDSNVIIRSILLHGNSIEIGAGGGITYLSDPDKEYAEMCLKAEPLLKLFQL